MNYSKGGALMKKYLAALIAAASLLVCGAALAERKSAHTDTGTIESAHVDVKKHRTCSHCGMDREKFSHSRMMVTYPDGRSVGVCSIHCLVTELRSGKGGSGTIIEVADMGTGKLVAAEKAAWVVGGGRKGVMTRTPKWAFARKPDADAFISVNGGKAATYNETLALAEKD